TATTKNTTPARVQPVFEFMFVFSRNQFFEITFLSNSFLYTKRFTWERPNGALIQPHCGKNLPFNHCGSWIELFLAARFALKLATTLKDIEVPRAQFHIESRAQHL